MGCEALPADAGFCKGLLYASLSHPAFLPLLPYPCAKCQQLAGLPAAGFSIPPLLSGFSSFSPSAPQISHFHSVPTRAIHKALENGASSQQFNIGFL